MSTPESQIFWPDTRATSSASRVGRGAGWGAVAMFFVWIGFAGLALVWNLEQRALFHRAQHHPFSVSLDDVRDSQARADFLNHALPVLVVVTAAFFITWLYVQYRRLHSSSAHARLAPGWAIGGWFVPIVNLVLPYLVVADVWKATGGRRSGGRALVACWWASYLLSGVLALSANGAEDDATTLHDALHVNSLYLARAGSLLVAAVLALVIVRGVLRHPVGERWTSSGAES
jgi:hypothetical protein